MDILLIIVLILQAVCVAIVGFFMWRQKRGSVDEFLVQNKKQSESLEKFLEIMFKNQNERLADLSTSLSQNQVNSNKSLTDFLRVQINSQIEELKRIEERLNEILKQNEMRLDKLTSRVEDNLKSLQNNNEKKLEEMRKTVDEKLTETLEKRLDNSVKIISEQLEKVSKISGEIQTMTNDMGDFKRMLTNVKTRGGWGEVQLQTLLEQVMSENQYKTQVMIKKNSADRVDFAIIMPGKEGDSVFLPIDAKFPLEDYRRLIDAGEKGDLTELEIQKKNLERRLELEAKSIKSKYINVPVTTDFAVMYLPIEGLYAEAVKSARLGDIFYQNKIMVCGPNTIMALLNSLQLGFKTLAIEKRSSEVWKTLGLFKQEFGKFVGLIDKTQKQMGTATKTIEDMAKKTKTIQTKLKKVEEITETKEDLELTYDDAEESDSEGNDSE